MKTYKMEDYWGGTIDRSIKKAKEESILRGMVVEFDFNGIRVLVDKNTNEQWLYRDYMNAHLMDWKEIGPDTVAEYHPNILLEIKNREAERDAKAERDRIRWEEEDKAQRELVEAKIKDVPMEVKDSHKWNAFVEKNQDSYGKCCVDYARDWARLMQVAMNNGETLLQCAERTSFELGYYGITGFMYGAAVQMLSSCWKHGEELRKWHNKEYGHQGEGVVNPAVFTIKN